MLQQKIVTTLIENIKVPRVKVVTETFFYLKNSILSVYLCKIYHEIEKYNFKISFMSKAVEKYMSFTIEQSKKN